MPILSLQYKVKGIESGCHIARYNQIEARFEVSAKALPDNAFRMRIGENLCRFSQNARW